ncbi:hypothetical protein [Rhodococcus erythropolis]|uniref:hypothetical protein n=1 Tax=Rhodococcus erythropolis TaxID=1833 RepID=UPI003014141B
MSTLDPVKGDTWHRGMEELEALGRARSENTRAAKGRWSTDLRKVYYLNSDYLETTDNPLEPLA